MCLVIFDWMPDIVNYIFGAGYFVSIHRVLTFTCMTPIMVTVACFKAMGISTAMLGAPMEHQHVCHVPADSPATSRMPPVLQVLSRFAKWTNA